MILCWENKTELIGKQLKACMWNIFLHKDGGLLVYMQLSENAVYKIWKDRSLPLEQSFPSCGSPPNFGGLWNWQSRWGQGSSAFFVPGPQYIIIWDTRLGTHCQSTPRPGTWSAPFPPASSIFTTTLWARLALGAAGRGCVALDHNSVLIKQSCYWIGSKPFLVQVLNRCHHPQLGSRPTSWRALD